MRHVAASVPGRALIAVEHWGVFDSGVTRQQLGIVPSMAAVGA